MEVSDLLKKENVLKAVAIVVVLFFLFSDFAVGVLGGKGSHTTSNETPGVFEGDAVANATIDAYEPYILTDSRNASLADWMRSLPGVDEVLSTSQGYVVSLKTADNITGIYAYLQSRNVSGTAKAVLSLPSGAEITTKNGTERVSGAGITTNLEPVFEPGETITIRLFVRVEEKRIIAYGAATVLPSQKELERNATIVALAESGTAIRIPWESRYDAQVADALANLTAEYGQDNVSYSKKDFVVANLSGAKPSYVTFVAGDTIFVGNMTNRPQVENDLGNATSFPDSFITVKADLQEFGAFAVSHSYVYNARIDEGGKPMFFALQGGTLYAQNDTVGVLISAYAIKDRIVSIISAEEAG